MLSLINRWKTPALFFQQLVKGFSNLGVMISNIWNFLLFVCWATYEAERVLTEKVLGGKMRFSIAFYIPHDSNKFIVFFLFHYKHYALCYPLLEVCVGGSVSFISSYVYYTGGARCKVTVILSHLFPRLSPRGKQHAFLYFFIIYFIVSFVYSHFSARNFKHVLNTISTSHWKPYPISSFPFFQFHQSQNIYIETEAIKSISFSSSFFYIFLHSRFVSKFRNYD